LMTSPGLGVSPSGDRRLVDYTLRPSPCRYLRLASALMCPASVEDLSQPAISTAVVYPLGATAGALRVNAALAARLTFDRREAHHLDLPLHPRGDARLPPLHQRWPAWKAELLQDGVVPAGARVLREHILAADPVEGEALFTAAKEAVVERSERIRDRDALPEGVAERITVVVRWPAPLEVGDVLLAGGRALGVVEAILDDGLEEPRIDPGPEYTQGEEQEVTRQLPTAAERMEARSVGRGGAGLREVHVGRAPGPPRARGADRPCRRRPRPPWPSRPPPPPPPSASLSSSRVDPAA